MRSYLFVDTFITVFLSFYIDVESNGRSEGELENFSLKIVRIDNFDRRNLIINNDKNSLYHTYIYIYIIYNELIYFSILNLVDSAIVEQILIQSHFFFFVFLYTLPFRAQIIAFERKKKKKSRDLRRNVENPARIFWKCRASATRGSQLKDNSTLHILLPL